MFETETMAELCFKQGLVREAVAIYRRLLSASTDAKTRDRRARRIAELDGMAAGPATATAVSAVRPTAALGAAFALGAASALSRPGIQARRDGDGRAVTLEWSLPNDVRAPALQILVVRRQPEGIATEHRTVPVDRPDGRLKLSLEGVHSVKAAAGRLDGDHFVPLARLDS
jgi:hypothetical protein